jgi:hypothetical protein
MWVEDIPVFFICILPWVSGTGLVFHDEVTFLFDTNLHYASFSLVAAPDVVVKPFVTTMTAGG